jgi:DeoD family purine-nucleoside phosphorylase
VSHIVPAVPKARPPLHLTPAAPLADRVVLPGDPHRALQVAQHLLERPRMFNHHRGLWGYTGTAPDGRLLSVQATGMGGPTTAIVVEELVQLGASSLVRVGTCGALDARLALGDLIVAREALAGDGASRALGAGERVRGDPGLSSALSAAAGSPGGVVATSDLFYDDRPGVAAEWRDQGALAIEMETATLFRLAELRGVRAASVLAVTDLLEAGDRGAPARHAARIERDALEAAGLRLGEAAVAALA